MGLSLGHYSKKKKEPFASYKSQKSSQVFHQVVYTQALKTQTRDWDAEEGPGQVPLALGPGRGQLPADNREGRVEADPLMWDLR